MTVYVEYIFLNNFAINYFILYLTLFLKKDRRNVIRMLISAGLGAVFSAVYPFLGSVNLYIKIPLSVVMVIILRRPNSVKDFLFTLVLFYLVSFCLAGGVLMLASYGIFDLEAFSGELPLFPFCVALTGSILLLFFRITVKMIFIKRREENNILKTKIIINEKEWDCLGFYDSGNLLYEPVSLTPVVLLSSDFFEEIKGAKSLHFCRELIIKTLSGEKKVQTFPVKLRVFFSEKNSEEFCVRAGAVDLKNKKYQIILHSDMIGG